MRKRNILSAGALVVEHGTDSDLFLAKSKHPFEGDYHRSYLATRESLGETCAVQD
jgi:hypothetical protein